MRRRAGGHLAGTKKATETPLDEFDGDLARLVCDKLMWLVLQCELANYIQPVVALLLGVDFAIRRAHIGLSQIRFMCKYEKELA